METSKPHAIFADDLPADVLQQFAEALEQPFSVRGALMPDAHYGYALPIGGVVATKDVVVPAWVGYDIGCGVSALPTTFEAGAVRQHARVIFEGILNKVPVGTATHRHKPKGIPLDPNDLTSEGRAIFDARGGFHHLGTLGGGNHFIEVGADENEEVWIVVHCGSRGVGHGLATEYMRRAAGGKARDIHAGLQVTDPLGEAYVNDMNWALEFARLNRRRIIEAAEEVIARHVPGRGLWERSIDGNHNHAEEREGVWIHRKGATHAEEGMRGVVPGTMRDGSFIVEGRGNPEALWSSAHGAGRAMGRRQAKRQLQLDDFRRSMHGITARVDAQTLDEAPDAYKDIHEVMRQQEDLVRIVAHERPILNIKG